MPSNWNILNRTKNTQIYFHFCPYSLLCALARANNFYYFSFIYYFFPHIQTNTHGISACVVKMHLNGSDVYLVQKVQCKNNNNEQNDFFWSQSCVDWKTHFDGNITIIIKNTQTHTNMWSSDHGTKGNNLWLILWYSHI